MSYYFAYGSNMDTERIRDDKRLAYLPKAQSACLKKWRLRFNKMATRPKDLHARIGWANIVNGRSNESVHGVLYEVTAQDLARLDDIENGYCRAEVVVRLPDGNDANAVTYVACEELVKTGLRPTREYLNHLLAGAVFLPPAYVRLLKRRRTRG
jgi:gamma-glutamylcyclotransferase